MWTIKPLGNIIGLAKEKWLIWVSDPRLGKRLKKQWIKRYKDIELKRSDREIIANGVEFILLDNNVDDNCRVGVVEYYQDITLFEQIDFEKPQRWMQIGMMPAKLALTLINIAVWIDAQKKDQTIYDPFMGFGTTNFLVNSIGHNTIGSDIKITAWKDNLKRRNNTHGNKDNKILFFKHDVTHPFNKKFLDSVTSIVTEGWLWPIIKKKIHWNESLTIQKKVLDVYIPFLQNIFDYYETVPTMVFTVPFHVDQPNIIADDIEHFVRKFKHIEIEVIDELYKRKKQYVWRQIIIITPKK